MEKVERAYEEAYTFNGQASVDSTFPQKDYPPEKVRRTREKPESTNEQKKQETVFFTPKVVKRLILLCAFAGAVFIGIILLNAYAADVQCSINRLQKQNLTLENDISIVNMKIESANTVEEIQSYATKKLGMTYPKESQIIHIEAGTPVPDDFAATIKEMAYKTE